MVKKYISFFILIAMLANRSIAADSLSVSPQYRTTSDSIRLSIIIKNQMCCTQNIYDSTAVAVLDDSTISLSYRAASLGVCPCPYIINPAPILTFLTFKRGPLPAGKYHVYEQQTPSCTGQICPDIVVELLIGSFTVYRSSVATVHQKTLSHGNIPKTSGSMRVFNCRGEIVSSTSAGKLKRTCGVYFVKPENNTPAQMKITY